jgi:hypothetical protein
MPWEHHARATNERMKKVLWREKKKNEEKTKTKWKEFGVGRHGEERKEEKKKEFGVFWAYGILVQFFSFC